MTSAMRCALFIGLAAIACSLAAGQPLYDYATDYAAHTARADLDTAAQENQEEQSAEPMPYSFEYTATDPEGSHSHTSSSDGRTVTGEYTIQLADGRMRTVKYVADENGYRAEIITNELGTESKNPADVTIESSAPTGAEAAAQGPPAPAPAAAPAGEVAAEEQAASDVPSTGEASHLDHIYAQPQSLYDYPYQHQQQQYYHYDNDKYTQ